MKILMIKDMKVHHILRIKHYYSCHFVICTSYSDGHCCMVFFCLGSGECWNITLK